VLQLLVVLSLKGAKIRLPQLPDHSLFRLRPQQVRRLGAAEQRAAVDMVHLRQGGAHLPGQLLPLRGQGYVQHADKPPLLVALGGAVTNQNQFHSGSPFIMLGMPQYMRMTQLARSASAQQVRPTRSRQARSSRSMG